jgi:hypothetical protein
VGWTIKAHTRKTPTTVEPLNNLKVPFVAVQAPGTDDYTDISTLTGLHFPAAGLYTSCYGSSGYVAFPTSSFNFYRDNNVQRIMWTVQIQSTESSTTTHPTYGDPTADTRFNCQSIIDGNHDAWIISMAQQVEAFIQANQIEVIARFLHEMDGNWYPWGADNGNNGNSGALLKTAWIHIFNLWRTNAPSSKLIWCPDSYSTSTNSDILDVAWPGEAYVDYVGLDVYNWGPSSLGAHGWRTPSSMFSQTNTWYATVAPNKKIIVCEVGCPFAPTGSFADNTGDKNAWIASLRTYLNGWSQCIGVFWMQNTNKGGCRVNRIRRVTNWQYPNPNSYGADTVGVYNDDSATAFTSAFTGWDA